MNKKLTITDNEIKNEIKKFFLHMLNRNPSEEEILTYFNVVRNNNIEPLSEYKEHLYYYLFYNINEHHENTFKSKQLWDMTMAYLENKYNDFNLNKIPKYSDRSIIIVDTRKNIDSIISLKNALDMLPKNWSVRFFISKENEQFIREKTKKLSFIHFHIIPFEIHNTIDYNKLIYNQWFWNQIREENLLFIQADSLIRIKNSDIEQYIKYDYVGARYLPQFTSSNNIIFKHHMKYKFYNKKFDKRKNYKLIPLKNETIEIGNGGFSFRHKSAILLAIDFYKKVFYNDHKIKNQNLENIVPLKKNGLIIEEDLFFCTIFFLHLDEYLVLPTPEEAEKFSVESYYNENPFGLHQIYNYLPPKQVKKLLDIFFA